MEIDSELGIESNHGQRGIGEGPETEPCTKETENEPCNDTEMTSCAGSEGMDVVNVSELGICKQMQVTDVVLDNTELVCSDDCLTKEVSNNTGLQNGVEVKDTVDVTESKPCSEVEMKEVGNCAELEPCMESIVKSHENEAMGDHCMKNTVKEAPNDADVEPQTVKNDSEMELCAENHAPELLGDGNSELYSCSNEVKEAQNDFGLEPCPRQEVKEPSNDDIQSEVSNPNLSPKHVSSSLTSSSQPLDVRGSDHGGCGETTSACSRNSCADGSFCEEEHSRCKSESVSTSCVVLEIPKHVRPTGIRKITFKFSKRKEDYDGGLSVAVKPLADDEFREDFYENQLSVSAAQLLSRNGFHNHEWNTLENAEMNLSIDWSEFHDTKSTCDPNREVKMSKKIIPENYPTNVKKLLSTRILEGAKVKYISTSKEHEILGIIKDGGYLCGCSVCNFSKVVSAYEFELHAGTKTRHPNNHVYLENGKPIYSIIQELRSAPLSSLDDVIKSVAGSSVNEEYFQVWKGTDTVKVNRTVLPSELADGHASHVSGPANLRYGNDVAYTDSAFQNKHFSKYHSTTSYPSHLTEDNLYPASCHYSHLPPLNLESYIDAPVERKRPIKKCVPFLPPSLPLSSKCIFLWDNDLHKLLFMPNGLPDGTDLAYYSKGKRILGGYKQGNGIVCSCCNTEISPSQFEAHAGWAAKRQPYRHIYTSSGLTLHDIALMLANGQSLATGGSDDMCAVCGDVGELILCNGCPRSFHAACLGLQSRPANDWLCHHCGKFGPSRKASGDSRPIVVRLKRVVKAPEFEPGGCVVCRSQDFSAANFDDRTVILCDQCEKEYHVGCLRQSGLCDLKELPEDKWFCCDDCNKIFETLQNLTSTGPEVIPASVSAAIHKKQGLIGLNDESNNETEWRILSGKSRSPEHLQLLSRAAAIFRECFDPIVARSGRDLIPVMVYGRNISGQEFSGMYCVVLIVKSVVVSAALLRIFGQEAAELPLVATSRENQGKGFFQALFSCIEGLLSSMSVKHLVLPAAEEAESMWTKKLGFRKTSHEQVPSYARDLQLTIFKGTSLLEKEVSQ
ncbi:hypothetical protein BUALT_Bualt11G0118000 [Buddleja alternifolia]|uniref:PHD-type domain-containing protein n=1 Tax=Buddleja alternifolia TaxID=168488 RepID=A0AAV6WTI5_9LAMI|nr:hypothetical protein BUALT_Bualt11G0118000 [Buddleja alternifolia]